MRASRGRLTESRRRIQLGGCEILRRLHEDVDLEDLMNAHGAAVLRVARRYSCTSADAEDAYQRAFELLLTKPPRLEDEGDVLPWLLTVVRNEALTIRRKRKHVADVPFEAVAEGWECGSASPADRVIEIEACDHGREALQRINPDQARCLLLRADGLSYDEIAAETGFTYAKVHRSISEGRRVYRGLLDRIDGGAECRRLEPMLSLLVDDELRGSERADLELHLKSCGACRAVVRDYASAPRDVASLFPVGLAVGNGAFDRVVGAWNSGSAWLNERVFAHLPMSSAAEVAFGKKLALAAAATGSILVGGVGVERVVTAATGSAETKSAAPSVDSERAAPQPVLPSSDERSERRDAEKKSRRLVRDANANVLLNTQTVDSSKRPTQDDSQSEPPPKFDDSPAPPLSEDDPPLDSGTSQTDDLQLP